MSTTTTSHRSGWAIAAALTAVVAVGGCTRADGVAPAVTSAPSTEATTAPSATSSTSTTTSTPPPTLSDGSRIRKPSEVSIALLDTNSFIAGVHAVPTPTASSGQSGGSGADPAITSKDPRCAAFIGSAGTSGNAGRQGVTGHAEITFQADGEPIPFLVEEITTVGTTDRAVAAVVAMDQSTQGCSKVTLSIPGAGSSTMTVKSVTPPPQGGHPTAVRLTGTSGPLSGLEMTLVATQVEDAVIMLNFIQESESDIQGITHSAVERATAVFAYGKPS